MLQSSECELYFSSWTTAASNLYLLQNSSSAEFNSATDPLELSPSAPMVVAKHTRFPFLRSASQISMRLRLIAWTFALDVLHTRVSRTERDP